MRYPGGKNQEGVYKRIISLMPPHDVYIEPFLGSGAVMRNKKPARVQMGIEIDPEVIAGFDRYGITNLFIERRNALEFLCQMFLPGHLIYCDPPYLFTTRASKEPIYKHEFGREDQHRQLLSLLLKTDCMVMISGYRSALYDRELAAWRRVDYTTSTRAGRAVTESVWLNFPEPLVLHDYRYLGDNYREREYIKRQKNRWTERLRKMPAQRRYALLQAIDQLKGE